MARATNPGIGVFGGCLAVVMQWSFTCQQPPSLLAAMMKWNTEHERSGNLRVLQNTMLRCLNLKSSIAFQFLFDKTCIV